MLHNFVGVLCQFDNLVDISWFVKMCKFILVTYDLNVVKNPSDVFNCFHQPLSSKGFDLDNKDTSFEKLNTFLSPAAL